MSRKRKFFEGVIIILCKKNEFEETRSNTYAKWILSPNKQPKLVGLVKFC